MEFSEVSKQFGPLGLNTLIDVCQKISYTTKWNYENDEINIYDLDGYLKYKIMFRKLYDLKADHHIRVLENTLNDIRTIRTIKTIMSSKTHEDREIFDTLICLLGIEES